MNIRDKIFYDVSDIAHSAIISPIGVLTNTMGINTYDIIYYSLRHPLRELLSSTIYNAIEEAINEYEY